VRLFLLAMTMTFTVISQVMAQTGNPPQSREESPFATMSKDDLFIEGAGREFGVTKGGLPEAYGCYVLAAEEGFEVVMLKKHIKRLVKKMTPQEIHRGIQVATKLRQMRRAARNK